jgi:hypothetical protein
MAWLQQLPLGAPEVLTRPTLKWLSMALQINGVSRSVAVVLVFGLGVIAAVLFHDWWIVGGVIGLLLLCGVSGVLGTGRKVTPQEFADELEHHLLGTGGVWDWDDTTSIRLADERLARLQGKLPKFDVLTLPERQDELKQIIAALRRGEVPDVSDAPDSSN